MRPPALTQQPHYALSPTLTDSSAQGSPPLLNTSTCRSAPITFHCQNHPYIPFSSTPSPPNGIFCLSPVCHALPRLTPSSASHRRSLDSVSPSAYTPILNPLSGARSPTPLPTSPYPPDAHHGAIALVSQSRACSASAKSRSNA